MVLCNGLRSWIILSRNGAKIDETCLLEVSVIGLFDAEDGGTIILLNIDCSLFTARQNKHSSALECSEKPENLFI
jgi:hypothetical protein